MRADTKQVAAAANCLREDRMESGGYQWGTQVDKGALRHVWSVMTVIVCRACSCSCTVFHRLFRSDISE